MQLKIISGFRSTQRQQQLYEQEVQALLSQGLDQAAAEEQAQRVEQKAYERVRFSKGWPTSRASGRPVRQRLPLLF